MFLKSKVDESAFTKNNQVELIRGGKTYFDLLLNLINNAEQSVHIQTYIFAEDNTGNQVARALKEAVVRGVKVQLLVDGYASQDLSSKFVTDLQEAGIEFRFFEPIFRNNLFYFGRRLHHKVVVVDARYGIVGGLNIADHYNDFPNKPSWLDYALFVEGDIAQKLFLLCVETWNGFRSSLDAAPRIKFDKNFAIQKERQVDVKMICNDWVKRKNEISDAYLAIFHSADTEIILLGSYFFPGTKIRRQMAKASKRGVIITVVVAGFSDVAIAKNAERWLYDWLLRKGVVLYEYQKNILHAKVAVCDNKWMTVGSYNINDLSAYASIELNLEVRNGAFCREVNQTIKEIIKNDCVQVVTNSEIQTTSMFKKIVNWGSYKCIRILLYLFTFYFKQQN